MNAKPIYLYILCSIACIVSSCTHGTLDDSGSGKGPELAFAVSGSTRASGAPAFNVFAVYGDMKRSELDNASLSVIFDRTEVRQTDNGWHYEGTQYWFRKYEYSFVAVTPLTVLETANAPRYSKSALSFTYTIPTSGGKLSSSRDVTDILAATHRRLYEVDEDAFITTAQTKVTFKFGHILSLVNFAPALDDDIMTSDEYILFRKLELSGFKTKAGFNILPASRQTNIQTDDMVVSVDGLEGAGNFTLEFAEPVKVLNDRKNVSLLDEGDAIIMLPQLFDADSEAKVVLFYTVNDDPTVKQVAIPLKNQKWDSGKSYIYRFTISGRGAFFDTTAITDWEVMDAGNINAR